MYFIGENNTGLDMTDQSTCEKKILLYDQTIGDYFHEFSFAWNNISTPVYTVVLGDSIYKIPSSAYVMCGEEGGGSDLIMFDEVIGRDIHVICIENGLRVAKWYIPRVIDVDVDGAYLYPMTNKYVPMGDTETKSFILTRRIASMSDEVLEFEDLIV